MTARIDPLAQQAEVGGRTYRLRLDCRAEAALVTVGEREYRVRLLQWREKAMLSRFTSLGAELVTRELVRLCADTTDELSQETATVLWEVAAWINDPSRAGAAVPFDSRSIATVMLQLCRATQLRPADFDGRTAVEVEEMWQALGGTAAQNASPPETPSSSANRIVILPDPEPPTTKPERVEVMTRPESDDGTSVRHTEVAAAASATSPSPARASAPFRVLQPARVATQREPALDRVFVADLAQPDANRDVVAPSAAVDAASTPGIDGTPSQARDLSLFARAAPHPGPLPAERGERANPFPEPKTSAAEHEPHSVHGVGTDPLPEPKNSALAPHPVPSPRNGGERVRVRGGSRAALSQDQPARTPPFHDDGDVVSSDRGGTPLSQIAGTPVTHRRDDSNVDVVLPALQAVNIAQVAEPQTATHSLGHEPTRPAVATIEEIPRATSSQLVAEQHRHPERRREASVGVASNELTSEPPITHGASNAISIRNGRIDIAGEMPPRQPSRAVAFRSEPTDVSFDNESLFDELADRLAEAAADMGIGEV